MNEYPNVRGGLKKMLIAQSGILICNILPTPAFISRRLDILLVLGIIAAVGIIALTVVDVVGLHDAGRDIRNCNRAFQCRIVNIVISIAAYLFKISYIPYIPYILLISRGGLHGVEDDSVWGLVFCIADALTSFLTVYFVCTSVAYVLNEQGMSKAKASGRWAWKVLDINRVVS